MGTFFPFWAETGHQNRKTNLSVNIVNWQALTFGNAGRGKGSETWRDGDRYRLGLICFDQFTVANATGIVCEILPEAKNDFLPEARATLGPRWWIRGVCKGRRPSHRNPRGYEVFFGIRSRIESEVRP